MATAIAVLADTFLLPLITSYQPGIPRALLRAELEGYIRYNYRRYWPTIDGLWLRHALLTRNSRILDLGLQLRRERHYANHRRFAIDLLLDHTCKFGTVTHLEALHARNDIPRERPEDLGATMLSYYQQNLDEVRANVRWLHTHHPETFTKQASGERAFEIHGDDPEFFAFLLRERLIRIDTSDFILNCVELVAETQPEAITSSVVCGASRAGRLDVLKWLHSSPQFTSSGIFTREAMDTAASRGQLDVVKLLHEYRTEGCSAVAMENAAAGGYEAIVRFLREQRGEVVTPAAVEKAIVRDRVEVAKYVFHSDDITFAWRASTAWRFDDTSSSK